MKQRVSSSLVDPMAACLAGRRHCSPFCVVPRQRGSVGLSCERDLERLRWPERERARIAKDESGGCMIEGLYLSGN